MPKDARKKFENLGRANTAERFDCLQQSITEGSSSRPPSTQELRGMALRDFESFLEESDKAHRFAGLRRVMTECGAVAWTSGANADPVTLSTKVASITDEKSELQEKVAALERQLEDAKRMAAGALPPVRVPPPPPPRPVWCATTAGESLKLEQKSGWLHKKGGMINTAYQKRFFTLKSGVLSWYASEPSGEGGKDEGGRGWISCCGLEIEADTGENGKGGYCFAAKALTGSTTRRIELACASSDERLEWVHALQQLQPVHLPAPPNVLFTRVMAQVRQHAGAAPHSLARRPLARTA